MKRRLWILVALGAVVALPAARLQAQDPIKLGIRYQPGIRPGVIVVAGPGLDSVRKVVERDLQFSDRFEMAFWPDSAGALTGPLNLQLYRETLGLTWAVELQPAVGGVRAQLHHLPSGETRLDVVRGMMPGAVGAERMPIHQLSDELTKAATGGLGIAATRILFQYGNAIWSIDGDGANMTRISRGTGIATSPTWSADGSRVAFTELRDYGGVIIIQNLATGSRQTVPTTTGAGMGLTPAISPQGTELMFAWSTDRGTDIYRADVARMCCVLALTASGKLADNMSPAYSPDGRRVAFMSTRPGRPQIYVMDQDGANQRALVPFDGTDTGASFAPDWSPDGERVAFHRDIAGGRQVMVYDFASGRATAVTSVGRNEDPSWAPDSRHLVFRSTRSAGEQLWVLDLESGMTRQLTNVNGRARLPAWSPSFAGSHP